MSRQETLAEVIRSTKALLIRYLAGFTNENRTKQAVNLPNHAVWCLGHCALTMNRMAERFDGQSLPASDFIMGDGASGDARRFDTESVCFGSEPIDDLDRYPALERGVEIYESACDRFAAAIRAAPDEKLDESIPWHDGDMTLSQLVMRICFHNGTHAGQLTDLRRALSFDRVIMPRT